MSSPHPPPPLQSLTQDLKRSVRERMESSLIRLVTKNSETIFFRDSTLLSAFRSHISSRDIRSRATDPEEHDEQLVNAFYTDIPLSSYDEYRPFVARFFDTSPCSAPAVRDLLSPGFPEFIAQSSGTSGSNFKFFPIYPTPRCTPSYTADGVTYCAFANVLVTHILEVGGEEGGNQCRIPVTNATTGLMRRRMGIELGTDKDVMTRKPPLSSTPFAVWYIPSSGGNLLMTLFFAIMDKSLVVIRVTFPCIFCDAIRILEQHWDAVVENIEKGTIPDVFDLGDCKPCLESHVKPNPDRAQELRMVDRSVTGWLKAIWPSLAVIVTSASGIYTTCTPKIRNYVGPSVDIQCYIYGASECLIGLGYDPVNDHNLFRVCNVDHFEYLDFTEAESAQALHQAWQLEYGKQYELVVTTQDGLWRYRMGDIVEIGGFDPRNGQPLIRFIERRGVVVRIAAEFLSERVFYDAIHSVADTLGRVLEFVTEVDDRNIPRCYGFFVELDGEPGPDPNCAPTKIHDFLCRDPSYKKYADYGRIGMPTIRRVAHGTFQEYREWRMAVSGNPMGQTKVPIITIDPAIKEWLAKKVILEVGNL